MKKSLMLTSALMFISALANGAPFASPPVPKDNPISEAKVTLGKALFFDPLLSADGTISCNSCHNVFGSGTDNRSVSMGVQGKLGGRSAPTVWNAAFLSTMFWDGRAASLEEQALGPITNPVEMGTDHIDTVIMRLKSIPDYVKMFSDAFGKDDISAKTIAQAIATFERTLVTEKSPFDKFMDGDKTALSKDAQQGYLLFQEVGCTSCHSGQNFAGPALPQGTGFFQKFPTIPNSEIERKYRFQEDMGRFTVTGNPADKNMWRVPTLRNIAVTAPYFHNGAVPTLNEAIRIMAKVQLNRDLNDEQAAKIEAFLTTLTGVYPKLEAPRIPQSSGFSHFGPESASLKKAVPRKAATH